jgi:hypothetical protein
VTPVPVTVVETYRFIRDVEGLLADDERLALIEFLAHHPEAGDVMPGTGGVRKLRWGLSGRGKRGGVRAIYYFYNETKPIFLITAFAKNEKADLTQAQKNAMRHLTTELITTYRQGQARNE